MRRCLNGKELRARYEHTACGCRQRVRFRRQQRHHHGNDSSGTRQEEVARRGNRIQRKGMLQNSGRPQRDGGRHGRRSDGERRDAVRRTGRRQAGVSAGRIQHNVGGQPHHKHVPSFDEDEEEAGRARIERRIHARERQDMRSERRIVQKRSD